MRTDYRAIIRESEIELGVLERRLRGQEPYIRVRMLRLLKSGQASDLRTCAKMLDYSTRQINRWWATYRIHGIAALLEVKKRPGRQPQVSHEAREALREEVRAGRIIHLEEARQYLAERWDIQYRSVNGIWWLLRRHNIKLQSGR
jgi:transposase